MEDPTRIIITTDDGQIQSISANKPVAVVTVEVGLDELTRTVHGSKKLSDISVVPNDLETLDDPESANVFESYIATEDSQYVDGVHDFVNDTQQVLSYARLVKKHFLGAMDEDQ